MTCLINHKIIIIFEISGLDRNKCMFIQKQTKHALINSLMDTIQKDLTLNQSIFSCIIVGLLIFLIIILKTMLKVISDID